MIKEKIFRSVQSFEGCDDMQIRVSKRRENDVPSFSLGVS